MTTTTARSHRQHSHGQHAEGRAGRGLGPRLLRLFGALGALVATVAGPPMVLLALVGNPLDPPAAMRSAQVLTDPVDDAVLLWLLAAAVWLLWTHLLGTLIVEALRQIRGSTLRMPLPGLLFGANTALASHLIATLLLTMQPSNPTSLLTPAAARLTVSAPAHVATGAPTDTPPSMMLTALSTGMRTTERGAEQDGGTAVGHEPGQPAAESAPLECRVLPPVGRHHDTLWDIAERHLGDGTRWRDIYALNEGRLMPDGNRLTRASLIYPGWILRLPADAAALEVDRIVTAEPALAPAAPASDAAPTVDREPHPRAQQPTPSIPVPPRASLAQQAPSAQHRAAEAQPPPVRLPSPAPTRDAATAHPTPSRTNVDGATDGQVAPAAVTGLLSLAALGLLAALTRRRKVAARRRPPGARAATPPPELHTAEAQLRRDARAASDIAATVRLAMLLTAQRTPGSSIKAIWHHPDDSLELVLTHPGTHGAHPPGDVDRTASPISHPAQALAGAGHPPFPFEPTPRGWRLRSEHRKYLFATSRTVTVDDALHTALQTAVDPFPLLLPVGHWAGSTCLVNLEMFGLISLTPADPGSPDIGDGARSAAPAHDVDGDRPAGTDAPDVAVSTHATDMHRVRAILGAYAQALAGAPWTELSQLTIAPELASVSAGLDRITVLSPQLLSDLDEQLDRDEPILTGQVSLADARRSDPDGAGIIGTVAVIGVDVDLLPARLLRAATRPTHPLVVLLAGPHPDAHSWQLHPDGTLTIPGIAEQLQPPLLDPNQNRDLLRLLEHAQDPPQARPDDSGRRERDADTPPTPPPTAASPSCAATVAPPDSEANGHGDVTGEPSEPADGQASNADVLGEPAPSAGAVEATDLTSWDRPDAPADSSLLLTGLDPGPAPLPDGGDVHRRVQIGVLGPLEVDGTTRPPRNHLRALLVYLAVHRRPVQPEQLWEAVWPDKEFDGHILRSRMSDLKRYLNDHVERDGRAWQLGEQVRCDWQQFKALAAGDPREQLAALALVRGRPFEDLDADWMHLEGQHAEIEAAIVDLALLVAERSLAAGDDQTASTAAAAGLRASPYEERLYQLAMRAAAARGAHNEIRALRRQLERVLDDELEPDDTIQPGTSELYRTLLDTAQHPR